MALWRCWFRNAKGVKLAGWIPVEADDEEAARRIAPDLWPHPDCTVRYIQREYVPPLPELTPADRVRELVNTERMVAATNAAHLNPWSSPPALPEVRVVPSRRRHFEPE